MMCKHALGTGCCEAMRKLEWKCIRRVFKHCSVHDRRSLQTEECDGPVFPCWLHDMGPKQPAGELLDGKLISIVDWAGILRRAAAGADVDHTQRTVPWSKR